MKRISFKTASEYLGRTDTRTIISWCKRHGVTYFKDGGWYVFEEEFLAATKTVAEKLAEKSVIFTPQFQKYIPTTKEAIEFERKFAHIPY